MRYKYIFTTTCFLFLISGCVVNKDLAQKSTFTFISDGNKYQITSVNTSSGEGTNYLSKIDSEGNQLSLARDLDQDGSIDIILKGDFSIYEANMIYNLGIDKAKSLGNYAERSSLRTFEYLDEQTLFTIKTYLLEEGNANNLFIILNKALNEESIFLDSNADGIIDSIEKGTMSIIDANIFYMKALKLGIKKGKIQHRNNNYWVKEVNILNSATAHISHN